MSQNDQSVIGDDAQVRGFVERDKPVPKKLGFHQAVVKVGYQGRLFRNGALERDLAPGRHTWWNLFSSFTLSQVDSRVRLLTTVAHGSVPGPEEQGTPSPPCRVKVPLRISTQLANIETFLNVDTPLGMLEAMINNYVTTLIGRLRYDQYNDWVSKLRDELERYLQFNAVPRTGLQVLEVFIEEPQGQSESDKRQLRIYQTVTDIKTKIEIARGSKTIQITEAEADAREAELLDVPAWLNELSKTPEGVRIIEADLELRKVALSANLIQGSDAAILPNRRSSLASDPEDRPGWRGGPGALPSGGVSVGPDTPPRPTYTAPWPGQFDATAPSGTADPFQPITGDFRPMPTQPPTQPPAPVPATTMIDPARLQAEREHFPSAGFVLHETAAIVEDTDGNPAHGYEFTLRAPDGTAIIFNLVSGYPNVPPVVFVKRTNDPSTAKYRGQAIRDWSSSRWLSDIVHEVLNLPHS